MLVSPKISVLKANSKVMLFESGNSVLIHGRNEIRACSLPQKDKARVQQESQISMTVILDSLSFRTIKKNHFFKVIQSLVFCCSNLGRLYKNL